MCSSDLILAGVQHVLTLFGATTLVPLIFGPAMGMDVLQVAAFISCVYFGMGVATLIQTHPRLGSGLPIVQGSSFSFIPSVMTVIGAYKAMGPEAVMQYIGGALILGGILLSVVGYSGIVGYVRKVIYCACGLSSASPDELSTNSTILLPSTKLLLDSVATQ